MKEIYQRPVHGKIPAMVAIKKALEIKVQEALDKGDVALSEAMRKRYEGLDYGDVEVESVIKFDDGKLRVCLVARNRGWARFDLEISPVTPLEIVEHYDIPHLKFDALSDIVGYFNKKDDFEPVLIHQAWDDKFGIIVSESEETDKVMTLLGSVLYTNITYYDAAYDDPSLTSGKIVVKDDVTGDVDVPVYIKADYEGYRPTPEGLVVTREPMVSGVTNIVFTVTNQPNDFEWIYEIDAPNFDIGEGVESDNGLKMTVPLTLKREIASGPKHSITGSVTVNRMVLSFDKSFSTPAYSLSGYGVNHEIKNEYDLNFSFRDLPDAETIKVVGDVKLEWVDENDVPQVDERPYKSIYQRNGTLYVYAWGPLLYKRTQVTASIMVETGKPDSAKWVSGEVRPQIELPNGATKIIVQPKQINRTDSNKQFLGVVDIYFNDPDKTRPEDLHYSSSRVETPDLVYEKIGTSTTADGYSLTLPGTILTPIETMTVTSAVSNWTYREFNKSISFQHRLDYTGGAKTELTFISMDNSELSFSLVSIDEDGVSLLDIGYEPVSVVSDHWSSLGKDTPIPNNPLKMFKIDRRGGWMNKPTVSQTDLTFDIDGERVKITEMIDYKPVKVQEARVENYPDWPSTGVIFVKLDPDAGLTSADLLVQKFYRYDNGSVATNGSVTKWDIVDDYTISFLVNAMESFDKTSYRFYLSDRNHVVSSTEVNVKATA